MERTNQIRTPKEVNDTMCINKPKEAITIPKEPNNALAIIKYILNTATTSVIGVITKDAI